jgi:hypothetical protein
MIEKKLQKDRLVVLFLLGILALNYPLLDLFDKPKSWHGIPVLYLYIFIFWLLFICLLAFTLSNRARSKPPATFPEKDDPI